MVPRFNCRPDDYDEFMFAEEGGQYVKAEDYDNLLALLREAKDTLETSVPLRGDCRHGQVLAKIKAKLEES